MGLVVRGVLVLGVPPGQVCVQLALCDIGLLTLGAAEILLPLRIVLAPLDVTSVVPLDFGGILTWRVRTHIVGCK